MESSFKDKKAIVTGGARGIGRDIASSLAAQGAFVYVLDILQDGLESLKKEYPNNIQIAKVDLQDWNLTQKVLEQIEPVDYLVNNAGIGVIVEFLDTTPEMIDKMFNVNVKAIFAVSQMVIKKMIVSKKFGSIVNISSQLGHSTLENASAYCATKSAVNMLTKSMAREMGKYKIRVNAVSPTFILTDLTRVYLEDKSKSGQVLDRIPLGRWATTKDVINAVEFLLSDKANMITGDSLLVDGGYCSF